VGASCADALAQYLAYNSSYWLNTKGIWEDWPVRQLDRWTKVSAGRTMAARPLHG
jgi:hypothetical protein